MLALIAASLIALQADELAEAAKKTAALENYSFKEESKASKGKHQPGPIDGRDVRRSQLKSPELAGIPTVVVTATEPDGGTKAQLQADAWIEKPFRFDDLLSIVRQYVTPNG